MKLLGNFSLMLFGALFLFQSCIYDEGSIFTLRTKKARISQEWSFYELEIDGVGESEYVWEIEIEEDGTFIDTFGTFPNNKQDYTRLGTWEFADGKEKVVFTFDNGDVREYTIRKLTMDEFWIDFLVDREEGLQKWEAKFSASS